MNVFWKAERQAEKVLARTEEFRTEQVRPHFGTVEDLVAKVQGVPLGTTTFDLWVPETLILQGSEVSPDVAMALVLDKVLKLRLSPNGFISEPGGRLYKYRSE